MIEEGRCEAQVDSEDSIENFAGKNLRELLNRISIDPVIQRVEGELYSVHEAEHAHCSAVRCVDLRSLYKTVKP
jgi:hypothetical protein